jgi:hypothetical protein
MNWFRQNRFLGTFLLVFGVATIAALFFVWSVRSSFHTEKESFDQNAAELSRLQRLTPFPNEANLEAMKGHAANYAADLEKVKNELKTRVLPQVPLAPNEFQARLRQAVTNLTDKARANRVRLPENFFLGFEEFAAALPDTSAAPVLGQQLAQAEFLMSIMLDARVEAVTAFRRVPANEASLAPARGTPTPAPAGARKPAPSPSPAAPLLERAVVEASFLSAPSAARRVVNQISAAPEQFYIIRTLHVLNENDKGPAREEAGAASESATPAPRGQQANNSALNFIVGNEKVQTSARIEMLRFAF